MSWLLTSWPGSYGGFFVNRARRFFLLLAAGSVATGSRPAPGVRSLGQREISVSGALSRPKPPEGAQLAMTRGPGLLASHNRAGAPRNSRVRVGSSWSLAPAICASRQGSPIVGRPAARWTGGRLFISASPAQYKGRRWPRGRRRLRQGRVTEVTASPWLGVKDTRADPRKDVV